MLRFLEDRKPIDCFETVLKSYKTRQIPLLEGMDLHPECPMGCNEW